jgi:hypothetical protein
MPRFSMLARNVLGSNLCATGSTSPGVDLRFCPCLMLVKYKTGGLTSALLSVRGVNQ